MTPKYHKFKLKLRVISHVCARTRPSGRNGYAFAPRPYAAQESSWAVLEAPRGASKCFEVPMCIIYYIVYSI